MHRAHLSAITLNHTDSSVPRYFSVRRNSALHHLIYTPLIPGVLPVAIERSLEDEIMENGVLIVPDGTMLEILALVVYLREAVKKPSSHDFDELVSVTRCWSWVRFPKKK